MAASTPLKAGTALPEVSLHKVGEEVSSTAALTGKQVLVGVPGAFTPTCHLKHLPGYVADAAKFKEAGVSLAVVSVNDAFVMKAWGEATGATEAGIQVLADPTAALAKALGVETDIPPLGGVRSQRFAAYIEEGTIKHLVVDSGDESSFAPALLKVVTGAE